MRARLLLSLVLILIFALPAHALDVLALGQSNMSGGDTGGTPFSAVDLRVKVWNNDPDNGPEVGTAFVSPTVAQPPFRADGSNNLVPLFCHRAVQEGEGGGLECKAVIVARGGTPSADFIKGSGFMYDTLAEVYVASGQGPADVVLWHQGESDQGSRRATDPEVYKARILELISNLKADGFMKESAPFIAGGLCKPNAADIDQALRELAAENEGIYYASQAGIPNLIPVENHFTGAGLVTLGLERYWAQYRQAVSLTPQSRPLGDNGGTTGKH